MRKLLAIICITLFITGQVISQDSKIALHIYNPTNLFQKAGAKVEYRSDQMGFLVGAIQYYGSIPSYPGTQLGLEVRHYALSDLNMKKEKFIYARVLAGHQEHMNAKGDGFLSVSEVPEGNYYGAGAGIGRHFNYGHFFIDINAGLKYVYLDVKQEVAFYITGPASYLDLHFNVGFQF